MPFTPFHFGPGLLAKSLAPGLFSFSAFVCTQVLIDCESLYNLWMQRWPVHRFFHSVPGATLAGLVVAGILGLLSRQLGVVPRVPFAAGESRSAGLLLGGLFGGVSHSILDRIMHSDVRLLYPLDIGNQLHGIVGLPGLHLGCVFSGLLGIGMLGIRWHLERAG